MSQNYSTPNNWSVIEEGYYPEKIKSSESLFSLGNGAMGQRANFEEQYSGPTFQGSYVAGIYYPDKTKVGWWKNGYPEYFAKVLNAPNWIGIHIHINGELFDLNTCKKVDDFRRELNMKEGWYERSFKATLQNDVEIQISSKRFLSMDHDELGAIAYAITPLNATIKVRIEPYIDSGIKNEDANWDEHFWETTNIQHQGKQAFIIAKTLKTNFHVGTFMQVDAVYNGHAVSLEYDVITSSNYIGLRFEQDIEKGHPFTTYKYGGYVTTMNHGEDQLITASKNVLTKTTTGFNALLEKQKDLWKTIWEMADIVIEGDVKAQQGIRFNIFHLNQTYTGKDSRLNIGPKGFTGEKYGGSTYWDTEAYCIPFYMATKDQQVARNLLTYRYQHLQKAMENAKKLGFTNGAALYPMVTMNGEECHNEWEITFEEIHRNGAIAFAIYNYVRYTGDYNYIPEMGLEVLIGIARFWHQRSNFSKAKNKYVILGVTGPNEYENNVNNNWYTNYIAQWCLEYAADQVKYLQEHAPETHTQIINRCQLSESEIAGWIRVAHGMYFPYSETHQVYLQNDGFLDKELTTTSDLDPLQRPINQKWSWDRILRSPYIKQADTLQGFYFFEDHFTKEELQRHFDFYEPFTVHESSLSPCVHSIQAAALKRMEQAYTFYLRTSRLDLDDYNKEVHEGLHITSMAGTWMSIVEGFGGMRIKEDTLYFTPAIPKQWTAYSFKVNFRNTILKVSVTKKRTTFTIEEGEQEIPIHVDNRRIMVTPRTTVEV